MRALGPALAEAARDYRYLLDRGYPERAASLLVGDRRRLDAEERLMLFRGVASTEASRRRRARVGRPDPASLVLLDAYNVAFTLVHYLLGKPCFLSSDGLLRDAGAKYGRVVHEELLEGAFEELVTALARRRAELGGALGVEAFLDAPVSRSGAHAGRLREAFGRSGLGDAEVRVERSADGAILARAGAAGPGGEAGKPPAVFVASSDSVLVERCPRAWDLAREILEGERGAHFEDFGAILDGEEGGAQARG